MRIATALCCVCVMSACQVKTGLNLPCTLSRGSDDGGVVDVTEAEAQEGLGNGKDSTRVLISLSSSACDDRVCLRDSSIVPGTDMTAPAAGYCSRECSTAAVCASDDNALDANAATKLGCRRLVLDAVANAGVNGQSFCARSAAGAADAGI